MLNKLVAFANALFDRGLTREAEVVVKLIVKASEPALPPEQKTLPITGPLSQMTHQFLELSSKLKGTLDSVQKRPEGDKVKMEAQKLASKLDDMKKWWTDSFGGEVKKGYKYGEEFMSKFIVPMLKAELPNFKAACGRAGMADAYEKVLVDFQTFMGLPAKFPEGAFQLKSPTASAIAKMLVAVADICEKRGHHKEASLIDRALRTYAA